MSGMAISDSRDRELRSQLAVLYRQAPQLVAMDTDPSAPVWRVPPGSVAASERGIDTRLMAYAIAELSTETGMHLPLTQARALLDDAARCFVALASLTESADVGVRRAAIGPLARSAAEKAATVLWVLKGSGREERLGRALLVELDGIAWLRTYYEHAQTQPPTTPRLDAARTRLLEIADDECGGHKLDKRGRVIAVGDQRLPSFTARVGAVTADDSYAEQSVYTHPTGHFLGVSSRESVARDGLSTFTPQSTLHDEGRLCEPAALALLLAMMEVASLLAPIPASIAPDWSTGVLNAWQTWCRENGC